MVFRVAVKRLLVKRRIFITFVAVIVISVIYMCYQLLSINRLNEVLTSPYMKRKDLVNNVQAYQKADFPFHLLGTPPVNGTGGKNHGIRIRGVLFEDVKRYIPNSRGNFKCIYSNEEVSYNKVNDDFCDCQDGSDEPSTSACHNGRFFCSHLLRSKATSIPSSRVNDGICDCCDGSDEWLDVLVPPHSKIDEQYEVKLGVDQTPCRNRCTVTGISRHNARNEA